MEQVIKQIELLESCDLKPEHMEYFEIPSENYIKKLWLGATVKLAAVMPKPWEGIEGIWVTITSIDGVEFVGIDGMEFVGRVDANPSHIDGLKYADLVKFNGNHIVDFIPF